MKTYSESDIKVAIDDMIRNNEDNIQYSTGGYDRGYAEGLHDGLVDVLNRFNIDNDYEYYD